MLAVSFSQVVWVVAFLSISNCLGGDKLPSRCPSKATSKYLGELLKRNHPTLPEFAVYLAQSHTPIELLFDEEVLTPRFGSVMSRTAEISLMIELPEECPYLNENRCKSDVVKSVHYSRLPISRIRALAVVTQVVDADDGSVRLDTTTLEATFYEQEDINNDGQWDRTSCWEVNHTTDKSKIVRIRK